MVGGMEGRIEGGREGRREGGREGTERDIPQSAIVLASMSPSPSHFFVLLRPPRASCLAVSLQSCPPLPLLPPLPPLMSARDIPVSGAHGFHTPHSRDVRSHLWSHGHLSCHQRRTRHCWCRRRNLHTFWPCSVSKGSPRPGQDCAQEETWQFSR